MYTVYVLKDQKGRFYKGMTKNLARRLAEHRRGHTSSTKHLENVSVVYKEEYDTFNDARKRELYLKTSANGRFLKK